MLSKNDISNLNKCLLNDHLLLDVELDCTSTQVKVTDSHDLQWLTAYSITHGRDLQSLFESGGFEYLSIFIDNKNVSLQFVDKLKNYGLSEYFQFDGATNILISFPYNEYSSQFNNKKVI